MPEKRFVPCWGLKSNSYGPPEDKAVAPRLVEGLRSVPVKQARACARSRVAGFTKIAASYGVGLHIPCSAVFNFSKWRRHKTCYPLVICNIAIEHGPVEIVDFPIKNGGSFQFAMLVITRGYKPINYR